VTTLSSISRSTRTVSAEEVVACGTHIFGIVGDQQTVGNNSDFVQGRGSSGTLMARTFTRTSDHALLRHAEQFLKGVAWMRKRKFYFAAAALAVAAAVAGGVGVTHAVTGLRATPVTATGTISGTDEVWAPPPANAAASLTADQAWAKFSAPKGETSVPAGTSVQLGLITQPVGPYCGVSCDMWQTVDGISYRAYHQLAYGYYWSACPPDSKTELDCQHWFFLDANTGELITGALPRLSATTTG